MTFAVIGLLAGGLFLIPRLATEARTFLKSLTPLVKNVRLWVNVLTRHGLLWIYQGAAFCLFVRSFTPVQWTDAGILTTCFAFAWIVGFLSFLTPGGLGVREGLLTLLFANDMSISHATRVALLCRVWMLSAEIVFAGIAYTWRADRFSKCFFNLAIRKCRSVFST